MTMQLLLTEFDLQNTSTDNAIDLFFNCLDKPKRVTVCDLAKVITELECFLKEESEDWWALIGELSKSTILISFLKESLDDDFRYLIDAVEERSEQTIDESVVSDLIRVKQFFMPILKKSCQTSDELIDNINKAFNGMMNEAKELPIRINNCKQHVHGLKALYQHVANRGELTKEIIESVMNRGKI